MNEACEIGCVACVDLELHGCGQILVIHFVSLAFLHTVNTFPDFVDFVGSWFVQSSFSVRSG